MTTYFLGITASIAVFVFTIEIMRRGLIRERFAFIWATTSGVMLIFAVFNNALERVSSALSFKTPSNLLFFCSTILLISVAIQYAYELGRLEDENRKMAIEIAMIKNEIKKLNE
jgi:hypothetical protein